MPPDALPDGVGADGAGANGDAEAGTPGNVGSGGGPAAADAGGGGGGVAALDGVDGGVGGGTVADDQEGKGDEVRSRYFCSFFFGTLPFSEKFIMIVLILCFHRCFFITSIATSTYYSFFVNSQVCRTRNHFEVATSSR